MCRRCCSLAGSEQGCSFVQSVLQGSLREKSSNTLQIPSLTLFFPKRRAFGFMPLFLYSALRIYEHWRVHKSMDFTDTVRITPDNFTTWFIDHCSGNIDPRCTGGLQQSLVYLADVASRLNMLNSHEYKEPHEGKWWDLSWYSQGEVAKSADV